MRSVEEAWRRLAEERARAHDARQHFAGNAEQRQQFRVPIAAMDVEEQGARSVGDVGDVQLPARKVPHQPAVHRAEGEFAALCPFARTRNLIEQPGQLGRRKIRVDHQAGFFPHKRFGAVGLQFCAGVRRAPVLPDDGRVHGLPRSAFPQQGRLALVGDAEGGDVVRLQAGPGEGFPRHGQLVAPDVQGVMLDPAGLGIVLAQLLLRLGANAAIAVEDDGAGTGGALVEREKAIHRRLHGACGRRRRYSKREMNSKNITP